MALEECHIDELLEGCSGREQLVPGDIVTHRTYGPGASQRKGTLISVVDESVTVNWWDVSPRTEVPLDAAWDGSAAAVIAEAARVELYVKGNMHDRNVCERLSEAATQAIKPTNPGVHVNCVSITHSMSQANLGGMECELKFMMTNGHSSCDIEMNLRDNGYPSGISAGPIKPIPSLMGGYSTGVKP